MIEIDPLKPVDSGKVLYLLSLVDAVVLQVDAFDCWMEHDIGKRTDHVEPQKEKFQ